MEIDTIVSCVLENLVSMVSKQCRQEDTCFDFNEDPGSPIKLNFKRRHKASNKFVTNDHETSQNDKKLKLTSSQRIGYVFSPELVKGVSRLPKVKGRSHQVHELIASFKLLNYLKILPARKANVDELRSFHSQEYIDYIKSCDKNNTSKNSNNSVKNQRPSKHEDNNVIEHTSEEEENVKKQGSQDKERQEWDVSILDTSQRGEEDFGLGYDCPLLFDMFNLVQLIAGSTLTAVDSIIEGKVDIAINWAGGWHHALKDGASGFCYVNDIVIGILKLLSRGYTSILYVDFDLHHGDGVELAFSHTNKVFTLSFHKYEIGFFPGTGPIDEVGPNGSKGKGYTLNVPLNDGISDENFTCITSKVLTKVLEKIKPQVIVAQFGADGLHLDPMNSFNLTPKSLINCFQLLKSTQIPLVVLGGGGYNIPNVARCWTLLTASAIGCDVNNDIPDTDPFFLSYGPSYELLIDPGFRKDYNTTSEIDNLLQKIRKNLNLLDSSS